MTLENFNYRTNPLFLRNQFKSDNKFGIPDIPKIKFGDNELKDSLGYVVRFCLSRPV